MAQLGCPPTVTIQNDPIRFVIEQELCDALHRVGSSNTGLCTVAPQVCGDSDRFGKFRHVITALNYELFGCGIFMNDDCTIQGWTPNKEDKIPVSIDDAILKNFLLKWGSPVNCGSSCCDTRDYGRGAFNRNSQCDPTTHIPSTGVSSDDGLQCIGSKLNVSVPPETSPDGLFCAEQMAYYFGRVAEMTAAKQGMQCCCTVNPSDRSISGQATYSDATGIQGVLACGCADVTDNGKTIDGNGFAAALNSFLNPVYRAIVSACACPTLGQEVGQGGGANASVCSGTGVCKQDADRAPVSSINLADRFSPTNTCVCAPGFNGPDCSSYDHDQCPQWDGLVCANHAKACSSFETNNRCLCDDGWTGVACQIAICRDPSSQGPVCSNHGTCLNGVCDCMEGYTGLFCEKNDGQGPAAGEAGGNSDNTGNRGNLANSGSKGQKFKPTPIFYGVLGGIALMIIIVGFVIWYVWKHKRAPKAPLPKLFHRKVQPKKH